MLRYCCILLLIVFFISCSPGAGNHPGITTDSPHQATAVAADYLQIQNDSVLLPPFQIEVSLSPAANDHLQRNKESIIVAAWFSGEPKDTSSREYAESGEIFITSSQIILDSGRIARFAGLHFSKMLYDSLANKDVRVLVNVFSGRKSSPDNLLDCNILSDKMSAVKNRKITLTGKLIAEDSTIVH